MSIFISVLFQIFFIALLSLSAYMSCYHRMCAQYYVIMHELINEECSPKSCDDQDPVVYGKLLMLQKFGEKFDKVKPFDNINRRVKRAKNITKFEMAKGRNRIKDFVDDGK